MITYLPCQSESHARDLSAALWSLAVPPAIRAGALTQYYCGWTQDASGAWWLQLPDDFDLPVHELADAALFDAVVNEIERAEDGRP